jgi:GT2 family glycosyltransferase
MNKTAIVILNWNGLKYLKMFLGTIVEYSVNEDTLVCVTDNGSTDGSAEWITDNFKEVKLIRLDKNYGFAGGYNLAFEQLDSDYFVMLNSDIEVTRGWMEPLLTIMNKNPDIASCQPKILSYYQRDRFEYAGAAGGFIDKYGYPFCRGRIFNVTEKDTGQYNSQSDIFWSTGACMIVRADAWRKCNGLDSDFFAHMEEIDLCWRFHNAGYRVCCVPDSVVYHVGGGALPYNSSFKTYLNFRNGLFLLYKNLPENRLDIVLFVRKLLDGLSAIVFLVQGRIKLVNSVGKAHIHYYKSLTRLKEKRKSGKKFWENQNTSMILNKSIVFEFYIRKNKTYDSLKTEFRF